MATVSIPGNGSRDVLTQWPALKRYTPEFRLVLACLRWPLREKELLAIADAAEAVHDWNHMLRVATRHRVAGLVSSGLKRAEYRLPPLPAAEFQRMSSMLALQAMALSIESLRLSQALAARRIDALFLKGTAVAMLAYGDVSVRHAKDIDLLVTRQSAEHAMHALRESGYLPVFDLDAVPADRRDLWFRYAKSMDWIHTATGLQLELHWRLTDLQLLESAFDGDTRQRVIIAGARTLDTLECDRLLAYLCVHGASHGWMRLKWLADVYALLPSDDADACERVYRRLLELGAGRSAGQALLLCHDLLQLPLSAGLMRTLESDPLLRFLRRSALHLLTRGGEVDEVDDLPFGTTSVYMSRLMLVKELPLLISELRTWGYRPDELMKTRLPRPLLFLFPLIRLGAWLSGRLKHGGRSPHTR